MRNSYWTTVHPNSELNRTFERAITSRFRNWEPYIILGFFPQIKLTWDIINKISNSTDIFSCKFGTCKVDLPWIFMEDKQTHKFKIYRLGNFRRWDPYFDNYNKLMTNESFCDPQLELISYLKKLNNDEITATKEEVLHKTLEIQEYALLYCGKSYEFFDYIEFLIYFNARHNIYLDWGEWLKTESPRKWYEEFLESMKPKVFVLKSIFPEDKELLKKFEDF